MSRKKKKKKFKYEVTTEIIKVGKVIVCIVSPSGRFLFFSGGEESIQSPPAVSSVIVFSDPLSSCIGVISRGDSSDPPLSGETVLSPSANPKPTSFSAELPDPGVLDSRSSAGGQA